MIKEIEQRQLEKIEAEKKPVTNQDELHAISFEEFKRRDLGAVIYSEKLGSTIAFCSNKEMIKLIQKDNPGITCYEVDELKELSLLEPSNEMLKGINNVKFVFGEPHLLVENHGLHQVVFVILMIALLDRGILQGV